jgi:hypothetical protein
LGPAPGVGVGDRQCTTDDAQTREWLTVLIESYL